MSSCLPRPPCLPRFSPASRADSWSRATCASCRKRWRQRAGRGLTSSTPRRRTDADLVRLEKALAELEKAYSQVLFDRVGKTLRLNDTGQWLLGRATEILDRAQELEDLVGP